MRIFSRTILAVLILCLLSGNVLPQRRSAGRRGSPASAKRSGVVIIQAGLAYTMGAQPVARVQFHLLDEDLVKILQQVTANTRVRQRLGDDFPVLDTYALEVTHPSSESEYLKAAQEAIKPHIKQSITTDFNGNAQFNAVPVGTYYLMGITETRRGYAIWNLRLDVKTGQNKIILDQNNAATAL